MTDIVLNMMDIVLNMMDIVLNMMSYTEIHGDTHMALRSSPQGLLV